VTVQPTSLFAQTPTARFRQIEKMAQTNPAMAPLLWSALNIFPDAEEIFGDQEAEKDNIEKKLDGVVEGKPDEETMPHPYINTALGKHLCKVRINRVEADDGEGAAEQVGRLGQWWQLVDEIEKQQAAQAAQLQAVAAGATAGVVPGAAPPPPGPPALPPQAAPPMA
jgi:hypothetical protein